MGIASVRWFNGEAVIDMAFDFSKYFHRLFYHALLLWQMCALVPAKDDPSALAIKACDPSGQVIMLVSKLVPMPSSPGRFYAVGPPPKLPGHTRAIEGGRRNGYGTMICKCL